MLPVNSSSLSSKKKCDLTVKKASENQKSWDKPLRQSQIMLRNGIHGGKILSN